MTEKDTLLDIAVYCMMAKRGIASSESMIDRILDKIKPFCEEELRKIFNDNCGEHE